MTTSTGAEAPHSPRGLGALLTGGGVVGLMAAFVLTHDKLELLKNPDFVPSCNISAVLNCTNIMKSDQAGVFGFPNPLLGLIGFAVVITLGVLLMAKVDFPEWVWAGLQAGVLFGVGFVTWLQYQSLYEISALCPWCMLVWAVTIPIFLYVTLRNLRAWIPGNRFVEFLRDWHALVLILWFIAIATLIFFRFYA
ncbi:MAG: vitamin K epoxide reductase family protein [Actinomycetota bacterium]|nr:vitamin K epoxide reductase family protein [Actinomycetota bacterium]